MTPLVTQRPMMEWPLFIVAISFGTAVPRGLTVNSLLESALTEVGWYDIHPNQQTIDLATQLYLGIGGSRPDLVFRTFPVARGVR